MWKISGTIMDPGPAADGYMVSSSSYDGFMYVMGKGPSQTTVTAPQTQVVSGSKVVIQGTVYGHVSSTARNPMYRRQCNGHMDGLQTHANASRRILPQHNSSRRSSSTLAIDSNGNPASIGTATSDTSGSYQMEWTAPAEGLYKITATFPGSNSYGSSWAETGLSVGPAPTASPAPTQAAQPIDYTMTIVGMGIAIIIVVLIVGALIILRRK